MTLLWAVGRPLLKNLKDYDCAHKFIHNVYASYQESYADKPSINGRIFEYLVCETLAYEGIIPFYYQASFERVPNAELDVVLYHPEKPVVLTMKTSLSERYQQRIWKARPCVRFTGLPRCT